MCADPLTLTAIGAALFSTAAVAAQGFSAADVARYNARQEREASLRQEGEFRIQARKRMGEQTVALALSGARSDTDTPLLLLGESARNAELDALTIRQTGSRRAVAYEKQGEGAQISGMLGAGAQLLSGAVRLQQLGAINAPAGGKVPAPAPTTPLDFYG